MLPKSLLLVPSALIAAVVYGSSAKAESLLSAEAFPNVETVSQLSGDASLHSASGKELQILPFEAQSTINGAQPLRFLVQGGLHGNEQAASQFVVWEASRFARGESPLNQLSKAGVAFDFLPYANPDGDASGTRYNSRGVNLNRNFAVLWGMTQENPGQKRFSEAETQAIRGLFQARHYAAAVDVHGFVNWVVTPSAPEVIKAYGYPVSKAREETYRRWVSAVRNEARALPGYELKTGALLGDGGAFEDWAFWNQGTLAYCLELESPFRFEAARAADGSLSGTAQVDVFKRYEAFLFRTFAQAAALKRAAAGATLAGK